MELPKNWVEVSPTRYEYRDGPYHSSVYGNRVLYSYTVVVELVGEFIEVTINDEEAPTGSLCGAYLHHDIPLEVATRILAAPR
jgi:hypothetical protein